MMVGALSALEFVLLLLMLLDCDVNYFAPGLMSLYLLQYLLLMHRPSDPNRQFFALLLITLCILLFRIVSILVMCVFCYYLGVVEVML